MDVQFSGAVDFAPLFNNRYAPAAAPAPNRNTSFQSDMLHSQNAILGPLNQEEVPWMSGSLETGTIVDITA
ncbi:MAG TPA: hypothetical protein DCZ95_16700 [Verrucomicrobia bacterium]|nr:MAG: hypothetical protein A2X46_03740 [Lentisphaerae bacterium GWF2_57_35]HBA85723.1 hypothetical protein [Verrucomicrobiota bacterium]